MRIRLVVLAALVCLMVSRVSAQDNGDWYLAWTEEGALLSFTPDGEAKTLFEGGMNGDARAWRLDDGSVLIMWAVADENGGGYALSHLTSEDATFILLPIDVSTATEPVRWQLLALKGNYAVLADQEGLLVGMGFLIDLQANSTAFLGFDVLFSSMNSTHPAAFSEDGLYFRYLLRDAEQESTWTIRERKLETGAERVIFTIEDDPFPLISTDVYGEQWIDRDGLSTTLIDHSGAAQVIEYDSPQEAVLHGFYGDHLISYPAICEEDCVMEWKQLPDGEPLRFRLPESDTAVIPRPLSQPDQSHLLAITDAENLWLLSTDDEHVHMGTWSPETLSIPPNDLVSPDGRWLLTLTDDEDAPGYQVWDLETLQPVLQSDPEREFQIVQITYGAGGFIVAEDTQHFQFFRSSDQQTFDLGEPGGFFWNVQSDGTLLYTQFKEADEGRGRGIYRYDVDTQAYTLLVEGGVPLFIQEGI